MRAILAALILCALVSSPARARHHHTPRHVACGERHCSDARSPAIRRAVRGVRRVIRRALGLVPGGMTRITTPGGHSAVVAASAAPLFLAFLTDLEREYRVDFVGGYVFRTIAGTRHLSKHAFGLAIDVNQVARNRVTRALPADATALAARHGLVHGAVWSDPDAGHFEVAGATHAPRARRRHYAAAH